MNANPRTYLKYAIIAITVVGIYSCRKTLNDFLPEQSLNTKVLWAQEYYNNVLQRKEGNQVSYKHITNKISAIAQITSKPNMKAPMWARARADKTNLFEFVEVPLMYTTKISASVGKAGEKSDPKVLKASFDRLIIYKDKKGTINQRIITYIPTSEYLARHKGDISHNKINHLDKDFEGFLRYKAWDGTHLFTLKIRNGKAVRKLMPEAVAGKNLLTTAKAKQMQANQPLNALSTGSGEGGSSCIDIYYVEYSQMCFYSADNPYPDYCDEPVLVYEQYLYTICPGDDGYEEDQVDFCADPANFNSAICNPPADPCAKLSNLMGHYLFNNILADLRVESGSDHESAWTANFDDMTYNNADGNPNEHFVPITVTNSIDMWAHNHFNGGDPMFSAMDMAALYALYNNNKIRDINVYLHGVVTYQGTEYFLSISYPTLFAAFASGTLGNPTNFDAWSDSYYDTADALQIFQNLSQIVAFERAFMQAINGSGLQLFKRDHSTSSYKKMNYNSDGTTSLSNGCN